MIADQELSRKQCFVSEDWQSYLNAASAKTAYQALFPGVSKPRMLNSDIQI